MKQVTLCVIVSFCATAHAMQDEKDAAKDRFSQSSLSLHQQYATQSPTQMAIGTQAYQQLRDTTERLMNAHKDLNDMGQDTPESRAALAQHFQQLRAIIRANLPPDAINNGL